VFFDVLGNCRSVACICVSHPGIVVIRSEPWIACPIDSEPELAITITVCHDVVDQIFLLSAGLCEEFWCREDSGAEYVHAVDVRMRALMSNDVLDFIDEALCFRDGATT